MNTPDDSPELTSVDYLVLQFIEETNVRERDGEMPHQEQMVMLITILAWELYKQKHKPN